MRRSRGFTYIGLLIAVVLLGIGLALVGEVWNTAVKRERERELLFVGDQFRQGIGRYYESSPGVKQYPRKLEDLLEDKRFPVVKRHLRQIYLDPMTGKADWGLVLQGDQILGVYSQSKDKPFKVANFRLLDSFFADSSSYSDWRFIYAPAGAGSAGQAAAAADSQIAAAHAPSFNPNVANSAPANQNPSASNNIPQDPWVCNAARANDMRECRNVSDHEDCERTATQKYNSCIGTGAGAAQAPGIR
jgi:type II secretory pathway pseudopilin PulG